MSDTIEKPGRGPGRPPTLSPEERRRAILSAAEHVFATRGYAGAAMADIARAAGMSKKTVYAIFPNKRVLFEALAHDAEAFASAIEPDDDLAPLEALRRGLRNSVLFALSPRQILTTRLLIAAGATEQELAASFHDTIIAKAQRRHASLISTLVEESGGHLDDADQMARQLFGFAIGDLHILALVGVKLAALEDQLERQLDSTMALVVKCLGR